MNFFLMIVGFMIWLFASGNSAVMILFTLGFMLFFVFLIMAIISLFKRNGKAKKQFLMMVGAMVVWLGSAAIIPNDKNETKVEATEAKKKEANKAEKKTKEKAATIAKQKEKEEAKIKEKEEAEQKAREEAKIKEKEEAEQKAREEAEQKEKEEAEAKAQEEAVAKAKAEAEAVAKAQAEEQKKQQQTAASKPSTTTQTAFANCTELRKVYPNGVPSSHPAYQAKMDRDQDNYACER
jgi:outer membrane biosynthesis protein TonB